MKFCSNKGKQTWCGQNVGPVPIDVEYTSGGGQDVKE